MTKMFKIQNYNLNVKKFIKLVCDIFTEKAKSCVELNLNQFIELLQDVIENEILNKYNISIKDLTKNLNNFKVSTITFVKTFSRLYEDENGDKHELNKHTTTSYPLSASMRLVNTSSNIRIKRMSIVIKLINKSDKRMFVNLFSFEYANDKLFVKDDTFYMENEDDILENYIYRTVFTKIASEFITLFTKSWEICHNNKLKDACDCEIPYPEIPYPYSYYLSNDVSNYLSLRKDSLMLLKCIKYLPYINNVWHEILGSIINAIDEYSEDNYHSEELFVNLKDILVTG